MKIKVIILTALLTVPFLAASAQSGAKTAATDSSYIKPLFAFNPEKPMFKFTKEQAANENRLLRYYSLTGYREGVQPTVGQFNTSFGVTVDTNNGTRRIYFYNVSLVEMLTRFYGKEDNVVLEVKAPSKYRYLPEYGPKIDWMRKNARCFEIMLPEGTMVFSTKTQPGTIDKILEEILNLHFSYDRRPLNNLVLSRTSKLEKFKSSGASAIDSGIPGRYTNITADSLGRLLNVTHIPFIDETGYEGNMDIHLNINNTTTVASLNEQLAPYDLALKEEVRETDVFVITEPDYKKN